MAQLGLSTMLRVGSNTIARRFRSLWKACHKERYAKVEVMRSSLVNRLKSRGGSWREPPVHCMARLRLSRLSVVETGAARQLFVLAAPPLTVLRRAGTFASRISRRDWWPDQDAPAELVIITGSQESGAALHRAGMNFFYFSAATSFLKPVSSSSNLLPCKGGWF